MRPTWIVLGIILLTSVLPGLKSQPSQEATAIEGIRAVSKSSYTVEPVRLVQTLTDRFGPRLTGSIHEHEAAAWALDDMRTVGLSMRSLHARDRARRRS
jgi:hypothetical protein